MTDAGIAAELDGAACGLLATDPDDLVTRVNATFLAWTGLTATQVVGREFHSLLDLGSRALYATRYQDELWSSGEVREVALDLVRGDGTTMPITLNARTVGTGAGISGVRLAVFDATRRSGFERELLAAKRAAEQSESRVRVLQEAASALLSATDDEGVATRLAEAARGAFAAAEVAVAGYDPDGTSFTMIHGAHLRPVLDAIRATRPAGARALAAQEHLVIEDIEAAYARSAEVGDLLRAHRATAFSAVAISDGETVLGALACLYGGPRRFEASALDLQIALARQAGLALSRARLQERLAALATIDQLTGIANRRAIDRAVEEAHEGCARDGESMAVIFLDLDGFKEINDGLGHRAGDIVLQEIAVRLERSVRATDRVGRFGGDEFIVVCTATDAVAATAIAERVAAAVAAPIAGIGGLRVTASIGIAICDAVTPDLDAEAITRRADDAMYRAKRAGSGIVLSAR